MISGSTEAAGQPEPALSAAQSLKSLPSLPLQAAFKLSEQEVPSKVQALLSAPSPADPSLGFLSGVQFQHCLAGLTVKGPPS